MRLSTGPLLSRITAEGRRPGWTLAWFVTLAGARLLPRWLASPGLAEGPA